MNSGIKQRLILTIVVLAGLGIASALVMYALRANIDLFYTPGEILYGKGAAHARPAPGQRLRVGGMVMAGSVKRDPDTLKVSFTLYDKRGTVAVSYDGILPDLFREGQGIVAQGILDDAGIIQAREVLAKHDEKYTPPEISDAMSSNHQQIGETLPADGDR